MVTNLLVLSQMNNVNLRRKNDKLITSVPNLLEQKIDKNDSSMSWLSFRGKVNMASLNFKNNQSAKKYAGHELNFTETELDKKLGDNTTTIKLLSAEAPEYKALAKGDKKALVHLIKVADILNDVFLEMDHHKNLTLKKALEEEAEKGDTHAQKTLKLFNGMNGITGIDRMSEQTFLFKDTEHYKGLNFYPPNFTEEELKIDLRKKFDEDKIHEIRAILSVRTIVRKDENGELKAIDYVDAFQNQFKKAANELNKAAGVSTNADFNNYLKAQAKAFQKADPELDCEADRLWAKLQDTPLEFTLTREGYEDEISGTVIDDKALLQKLVDHKIEYNSKDSLGIRVGIVDKKGTEALLGFKKYLPGMADIMPHKEQYVQTIKAEGETKQTAVDVHLVYLKGDLNYRGGITLAENLPNDDKLSVKRDFGRRNVYHIDVRNGGNPEKRQKRLDAILPAELHKYSTTRGDHWFTIGHENVHSLGPAEGKSALGKWQDIIEEAKADMGSLFCLDHLVEKGKYTQEEKKEVIVSWANGEMLKAKPELSQAHRVRSVMQLNYFIEKGALELNEKGILNVNFDKIVPAAHDMLSDIIQLQLGKDSKKAETFVTKYFQWTPNMEVAAENIRTIDTTLHGVLEHTLADKLLKKVRIK